MSKLSESLLPTNLNLSFENNALELTTTSSLRTAQPSVSPPQSPTDTTHNQSRLRLDNNLIRAIRALINKPDTTHIKLTRFFFEWRNAKKSRAGFICKFILNVILIIIGVAQFSFALALFKRKLLMFGKPDYRVPLSIGLLVAGVLTLVSPVLLSVRFARAAAAGSEEETRNQDMLQGAEEPPNHRLAAGAKMGAVVLDGDADMVRSLYNRAVGDNNVSLDMRGLIMYVELNEETLMREMPNKIDPNVRTLAQYMEVNNNTHQTNQQVRVSSSRFSVSKLTRTCITFCLIVFFGSIFYPI